MRFLERFATLHLGSRHNWWCWWCCCLLAAVVDTAAAAAAGTAAAEAGVTFFSFEYFFLSFCDCF